MIAFSLIAGLLMIAMPVALAVETMGQVDFVVRGADSIGVKDAEVYVYVYNNTSAQYELYSGPHITADEAGRANNVPVPIGAQFFGVAYDMDDNVYADSNYSYENIWTVTDADHIQNVQTASTRLAYVHIYPGLYEAIEPTFIEPDPAPSDPDPAVDPATDPDPTPSDDPDTSDPDSGTPADPDPAATLDALSMELDVTVYDTDRDPMIGAEVQVFVTGFGLYSTDTTDGAGRTQALMVPVGHQFYAIAHDADGSTYGGTYDYYYDRANYWTGYQSSTGDTIENVSTGLTRIPYLHLFPEEFAPASVAGSGDSEVGFDPSTYECGGFPDAIYDDINPEECIAITYVHDRGIFTGTDEGLLEWNRPINRAEVTKVMLEAFDVPVVTLTEFPKVFPDVPTSGIWFSHYVYNALANDIVGGYPDGTFKPSNTINRVELLRIFIEASGADMTEIPTTYTFWHDVAVNVYTQWFIGYGNYAFFNDLLENDGNLYPATPMTRMDVIRLLYRASLLEV